MALSIIQVVRLSPPFSPGGEEVVGPTLVGLWHNPITLQASGAYFRLTVGNERIELQASGESTDA